MDTLTVSGLQLYPVKDFDQLADVRAQKREELRGRNNKTSCRSPTRDLDTRLMKNVLKEKRQLQFLKRRSVSPERCGPRSSNSFPRTSPSTYSVKYHSPMYVPQTLHKSIQNPSTANGHPARILTNNSETDSPGSKWASLWSEQATQTSHEKSHVKTISSTSASVMKETKKASRTSMDYRENSTNAGKAKVKTLIQTEKTQQKISVQDENTRPKKVLREVAVQTESGLVTVKESEVQQLSDYLKEALWREETMKKKMAALNTSTTTLLNSSNKMWTARYNEDLLRNKIKALEAQLQVCVQKLPKDAVKKLVVQMEKQKLVYEEKALVALQKATQEKTEALSKAETVQEALTTVKAEALRWQSLYEELKLSSGQLRENQLLSSEQLQQLQSQLGLCRTREAELKEAVLALIQEKKELQFNVDLLEEDNHILREELQLLRDGSNEREDFMMHLASEEAESRAAERRDSQVEEQLRHTQEKLQLKERECEELQTELHAMEQECQSSQARLTQCRAELRQLGQRHTRPTQCSSWWKVLMFFLLLLIVAEVAMLWFWYPPFREQVEDLYSDIEIRIEDYLMKMASPRHSGCFRPI
ncbi:uncharacterized protein V6R79_025066 [Siganus canaliculatus]